LSCKTNVDITIVDFCVLVESLGQVKWTKNEDYADYDDIIAFLKLDLEVIEGRLEFLIGI